MSDHNDIPDIKRRQFFKGATLAGAAALSVPLDSAAQAQAPAQRPAIPPPNRTAETAVPAALEVLTEGRSGSDFMVDCLKSLGFEYIAANPASSFRGLHESLINYGGNVSPEFLTCTHEEISVAMGHGYYKIEGKPLCVCAHGTVGLQHATMAMYNAWCDRVPVYVVVGNVRDVQMRRPGIEWNHTAQDVGVIARDYVKWDDYPASLQHFAESAVRAYKFALTPPTLPVLLVADAELQEDPIPAEAKLRIPKLPQVAFPQGDSAAVAETARLLVNAESPVLIADRYARTANAAKHLVELAEVLQCPIIDTSGRLNCPTRHGLNQSGRARFHVGTGRRRARPGDERLLGVAQFLPRPGSPDLAADPQGRRQDRQPRHQRPLHEIQFPGFPALRRCGSGDRGRCRDHHAGADRAGPPARQRRAEGGI